jgi:hypothetical protein
MIVNLVSSALLSLLSLIGITSPAQHHTASQPFAIAHCTTTYGTTQALCWNSDSANGVYLAMDHGHYLYTLAQQDLITR